jgi:predicted DNA-binding protein with PD1-like motif
MKTFALRFKPDRDLKQSLKEFVDLNNIQAGQLKQLFNSKIPDFDFSIFI